MTRRIIGLGMAGVALLIAPAVGRAQTTTLYSNLTVTDGGSFSPTSVPADFLDDITIAGASPVGIGSFIFAWENRDTVNAQPLNVRFRFYDTVTRGGTSVASNLLGDFTYSSGATTYAADSANALNLGLPTPIFTSGTTFGFRETFYTDNTFTTISGVNTARISVAAPTVGTTQTVIWSDFDGDGSFSDNDPATDDSLTPATGYYGLYASFTSVVVPEPATVGLFVVGAIGLVSRRRIKR